MKASTAVRAKNVFRIAKQAAFIWLISSLPLLCASGWQAWTNRDDDKGLTFIGYMVQNLSAGEAFLYVSAFVAPFFWVMTSYNDAGKRISGYSAWLLLSILSIVGSALLFAAYRAVPEGAVAQIPYIGIILYLVAFCIWVRSLYADLVLNLPELEEPNTGSRRRIEKISFGLGETE